MKSLLCALGFLASAGVVFAEIKKAPAPAATQNAPVESAKPEGLTASHRAAIEKLLVALQAQKNMEMSLKAKSGAAMGLGMNNKSLAGLPKEEREKLERAMKKAMDALSKELNWNLIKESVIDAYGKTFSEKEALEITAIMESPAGKLLVSKQQQLSGDLMRITQEKMNKLIPKITSIFQEEMRNPSN
jgi:hypothetical protein